MVGLTPLAITGSAADVDINFTCTATVEEDIRSPEYEFAWVFNDAPVIQSDGRINVCVCMHVCIVYMHTHIHLYIRTYTHTYAHDMHICLCVYVIIVKYST